MGIFYRPDTLLEGEVYIGYGSDARLMAALEDDGETARFFVDKPGPGDGGEMRARVKQGAGK